MRNLEIADSRVGQKIDAVNAAMREAPEEFVCSRWRFIEISHAPELAFNQNAPDA